MWSRDIVNHPQNLLSNIAISFRQPTIRLISLNLPPNTFVPDLQTTPFYSIQSHIANTYPAVPVAPAPGSEFGISVGTIQLDQCPHKIMMFCRPASSFVQLGGINRQVSTPNCFAELLSLSVQFGNTSGIFSNYTQEMLFQMSKKNGLNDNYCFADWLGTNT
jgi:hypothetical protein